MDAIELQNRLKNFTYRLVSLCESIPSTDRCRVFEHQLLSFAHAIDARVQIFPRNLKPHDVSLNIASYEIRQALWRLDVLADRKLISEFALTELKNQGDALVSTFSAPLIKNQKSNRNN